MNYTKYIKTALYVSATALLCGGFSSCEDNIDLGRADSGRLEPVNGVYVALNNIATQRAFQNIDIYTGKAVSTPVNILLTRAADEIINCKVALDEALIAEYNAKNGTDFEAYPSDLVKFENNGNISIAPGERESFTVNMTVEPIPSPQILALEGKNYLLPVSITTSTEGVKVRADKQNYFYVVKVKGDRPNARKNSGVFVDMFFEVNDTNPLNAKEWTLKTSGKPLVDNVCIFAANIRYDATTGRVYLHLNENVSALLNNRDKYIKPLQDMGITVTLCLLGDHTAAGLANLAPETAKKFAKELKAAVDAYGLDGLAFDDEWSEYREADGVPGFVHESNEAYGRLVYETKMLMPDKTMGLYFFGTYHHFTPVDGVTPGDFLDYIYEPYYERFNDDIWSDYIGVTKKQVSPYSRRIDGGLSYNSADLVRVRELQYGVQMIYNFQTIMVDQYTESFGGFTRILFDEDIAFTGKVHWKDY